MKTFRLVLTTLVLAMAGHVQAALYIVGSATESNWSREAMQQLSANVYLWEGFLSRSGELKFMTEASGWTNHWGPTKAFSPLSYGEMNISYHTNGDYKYRVEKSGYYRIQVNTQTKRLLASYSDGSLPSAKSWPWSLYPTGTAVPAGCLCRLWQDGDDTGIYRGELVLEEGRLSFHSRPYANACGARPVRAKMSSSATATKKQLYLSLTTDRCSYKPGETVNLSAVGTIPSGARVRYRHLGDVVADTAVTSRKWTWSVPFDDFRGYMAEVYVLEASSDVILGTIAIDVSTDWARFPRYGFVASFGSDKTVTQVRKEMDWLLRCHINAVQFQDWHCDHDTPLSGTPQHPNSSYKDIANRTIYLASVKNYIKRQHDLGMLSIFYNLCYGVLDGYQERGVKEEWLVFKDKSHTEKDSHNLPSSWKSDIYLADPSNPEWQQWMADRNDDVYAALAFDGYQIDQLGYRGTRYDYNGRTVDFPSAYAGFIQAMKRRHPEKRLIMNAVSEYGAGNIGGTGKMDACYNEVWGCHDYNSLTDGEAQYKNLKSIIDNNRSVNAGLQTIFAAYMNYCCDNVNFNTPGIVMTDAVMMALGGTHLELGGDHMLSREYFPASSVKMTSELEDWMTHYYDFQTAYENLLRGDWTENTAIRVSATGAVVNKWGPQNGQITQVARDVEGRKVIHLLNFHCQESSKVTDDNYLLCWHDRNGLRPWPVEYKELPIRVTGLSGIGKVRRVWVASPDYLGGALQEITDYTLVGSTLSLTVPALQFWTMIVIEPESTTMTDNTIYGPKEAGCELVGSGVYGVEETLQASASFSLPAAGTFTALLSLPDRQLTLTQEGSDAVISIPFRMEGRRPHKYLDNGRLIISREGIRYNAHGMVVDEP